MLDQVIQHEGLAWLKLLPDSSAAMIYIDPPFGHGTFDRLDRDWLRDLLEESWRVVSGIVYLHADPQLLVELKTRLPVRGIIVWRNGWISGYKSKTTRFWPRQYQLIVGYARPIWRWRRVERPKSPDYQRRGGSGTGFVVSDLWLDIEPVDQCSFSKEKVGYPTQKPLALLRRLIVGSTDLNDLVLDPTCGSGTTLIAALQEGRLAAGADISERAVELTRLRLSRFQLGIEAKIEGGAAEKVTTRALHY